MIMIIKLIVQDLLIVAPRGINRLFVLVFSSTVNQNIDGRNGYKY